MNDESLVDDGSPMDDNLDGKDAGSERKEPPLRIGAGGSRNAGKPNSRGTGVVSVLSLAASAPAVICFVTGHTTLSSFLSPSSALPAPMVSAAPTQTQTEQLFSQAAFFVHYGHLPGRGSDDYDADDIEDDRQRLIAELESYIVSVPVGPPGKAGAVVRESLARAQSLRHALAEMKPSSLFKQPQLPKLR